MNNSIIACVMLLFITGIATAQEPPSHVREIQFIRTVTNAPNNSSQFVIGGRSGIFTADIDGLITKNVNNEFDAVSITIDPKNSSHWLASGLTQDSRPIGVLKSSDGGESWGPTSIRTTNMKLYRSLAFSPLNSKLVIGLSDTVEISSDSGASWTKASPLNADIFGIAFSPKLPDTLYAATRQGLFRSTDLGKTWKETSLFGLPTTLIHPAADNKFLYAFAVGKGFLKLTEAEDSIRLHVINNQLGHQALMRIASASSNGSTLLAQNQYQALMVSNDNGQTWQRYFNRPEQITKQEKLGAKLYKDNCQQCHGIEGIGETYNQAILTQKGYSAAIPLDDTSHAWHHEDEQLVATILEGNLARGGRMPSWKHKLSKADAEALVAYIKTLWSDHIRQNCQGRKHMSCMRH